MDEVPMDTEDGQGLTPYKQSYVLIAIDTHSSMFHSEGQPTPFKNCVNALHRLSQMLLLKSDERGFCPFSVNLYNKDEGANLIKFKDNIIETTKLLKQKSKMSEINLKNEYMRNNNLNITSYFQQCKKIFKDISSIYYKRQMIFITNDPDPVCGDASKRFTALHEAKNFEENDINFQLVVTREDFDYDNFYTELLSLLNKPQEICEDEEGLFEKIVSTICFRQNQRKLCFYPFADDLTKYLTLYTKSYIKNERLLNNNYAAKDGTLVKQVSQNISGEDLISQDYNYVMYNADTKVHFDIKFDVTEKMQAEHNSFGVGYTMLYLSHRLTGLGEVIKEPKILEADLKEELPYFQEMWQYCVNKDKVLVCAKLIRKGNAPKPVQLIPKLIHKNKVFLEMEIAHANEIFEPENQETKEQEMIFSEEQKRVTTDLIERLSFEFHSSYLIDDEYVRKVGFLKAKLLGEERQEIEPRDLLSPEEIDEKIDEILGDFLECFPPQQGVKRK